MKLWPKKRVSIWSSHKREGQAGRGKRALQAGFYPEN